MQVPDLTKLCLLIAMLICRSAVCGAQNPTPLPPGEQISVPLPASIDNVEVGGAGRFLVLHLARLRKLAIFDVSQRKIVNYLPLGSDDIRYVAGMDKIIVVLNDQKLIQRWSLRTLTRELNVSLPEMAPVKSMALGAGSNGPLMVVYDNGFTEKTCFYDLMSLRKLNIDIDPQGFLDTSAGNKLETRASFDGASFTGWNLGVMPMGISLIRLNGLTGIYHYLHDTAGYLAPGENGAVLFTWRGLYNSNLQQIDPDTFGHSSCLPDYGGPFFIAIGNSNSAFPTEKPSVSFYTLGDRKLLLTISGLEELPMPEAYPGTRSSLSLEKRLFFNSAENALITVAVPRDRLVVHRLNIMEALNRADLDYLFVTSRPEQQVRRGQTFRYQIAVQSRRGKVQFSLESGPKGMKIDRNGRVEWRVPEDDAELSEQVVIAIRDASGQEIVHKFQIRINAHNKSVK